MKTFTNQLSDQLIKGKSLVQAQVPWLDGVTGQRLIDDWWKSVEDVFDGYRDADPKKRVKWAGPETVSYTHLTLPTTVIV